MNQPPLNPDALDKAALAMCHYVVANREMGHGIRPVYHQYQSAKAAVTAYLAAELPEVTSVEELDQLPVESVVRDSAGIVYENDLFDQTQDYKWARMASGGNYPTRAIILPARVLYRPEVKP